MIADHSTIDHIRELMRSQRKALSDEQRALAADQLAQQLMADLDFQKGLHIACYWAVEGELSCESVIKLLWAEGKHCYLPVINFTTQPKSMVFREYRPDDALVKNAYGISEPLTGKLCEVENLDCVLTPLVAFDDQCHRIGMGGGFYDRAFEGIAGPVLIGAGYGFQQLEGIEPEPWDVAMNRIVKV